MAHSNHESFFYANVTAAQTTINLTDYHSLENRTGIRGYRLHQILLDGAVLAAPATWWIKFDFIGSPMTHNWDDDVPIFIGTGLGNITIVPPHKEFWPLVCSKPSLAERINQIKISISSAPGVYTPITSIPTRITFVFSAFRDGC